MAQPAAANPRRGVEPPRRGLSSIFDFGFGRPSRRHWLGYLLLLPAVLLIAAIIVYPLLVSIDLSFQKVNMIRLGAERKPFTLANYERLFTSDEFWHSIWITIKMVSIVTVACLIVGFGSALLVNNKFKGRKLARLIVAMPWAVPEVVAVVIFAWIFDSSFGLVNWFLVSYGLSDNMIHWISDPGPAFVAVCITMIWKGYPFVAIMSLAGLQAIPEDLYNAAKVDGASGFQRFVQITVPQMMPVLVVIIVLVVLWLFRDFSIVYTMTEGGPVKATQTLSIMTYQQAFAFFKMGYASAIGVVTLVLCTIAGLFMIRGHSNSMY